MADTQGKKKKSRPRKRNKYKEYWELGDAVPVIMRTIQVAVPLLSIDLYSTAVPFCIFEFGMDYAGSDNIIEHRTLFDLYTKQHWGWYKFTSAKTWSTRSAWRN